MALKQRKCSHLEAVTSIRTSSRDECEECIKTGDEWVHLRTCQRCGVTLCCDSSPNRHASKHAADQNHPVVISAEPNERWMWCYVDEEMAPY